jgi:hypothetical protein
MTFALNVMGRKSREKQERRERERSASKSKWGNFTPYEPPIRKYPVHPSPSSGSTNSERLLARLARKTFLSTWSFPNVFRAERRKHDTISKEVCDLLVVFENDVLIFSDKDCMFPVGGTLDVRWARWYRRAIEKSAAQLHGAARVILSSEPLFLDVDLKIPFPLRLPDPAYVRVHRILVANGASEQCRLELGGSGTLMLRPVLVGGDHTKPAVEGGVPFAVGRVSANQPFVHILDDMSLPLLLENLDTAPDFINYLTKKEQLISSGGLDFAAGEEALLGVFLGQVGEDGAHGFVPAASGPLNLDERRWHGFLRSRERAAKLLADRVSYLWDHVTERFAQHFRDGTADHLTHTTAVEQALILQFFARENRTRRRIMAQTLLDMNAATSADMRRLRVIPPMQPGDPYWVLLLFPYLQSASYERNRTLRRQYLEACALVTKLMNPDALDIACFATESGNGTGRSEDAMYLDLRDWTPEMAEEARRLQLEHGILTNYNVIKTNVKEYPV